MVKLASFVEKGGNLLQLVSPVGWLHLLRAPILSRC